MVGSYYPFNLYVASWVVGQTSWSWLLGQLKSSPVVLNFIERTWCCLFWHFSYRSFLDRNIQFLNLVLFL